jgi:hypothetical protein
MLLPKQVIALGRIVAKVAGRYAYSNIRIERHNGRPRAMATDGRRAVVFAWDEPDAAEFPIIEGLSCKPVPGFAANVPPSVLAEAVRGLASRVRKPVLNFLLLDESNASVVRMAAATPDNVTRSQANADDAAFPPIEDVLPTPARDGTLYDPGQHGNCGFSHVRIGVNARQLAETLRVVADLAGDDENDVVVLTVPVAFNRPIRLDARCFDRRATAVVMPCNFTVCNDEERPAAQTPEISQATAPRDEVPVVREAPPEMPPNGSARINRVRHGVRRSPGAAEVPAATAGCDGGVRRKRRWWANLF